MAIEHPAYDLSALWDKHCEYEFGQRDVDATMKTMVPEPYVNHIPTMTGGVGHDQLKRFYTYHFVNSNPDDTKLIPISRTVGTDRVVDEMLFCFTHTREIDWMLPGVPPTGKYVEVPLIAIVCFRDGKLYNEHIYWDQASVLVQIGLLDPKKLPVAGIETARKLVDEISAVEHDDGGVGEQRRQADLDDECSIRSHYRAAQGLLLRGQGRTALPLVQLRTIGQAAILRRLPCRHGIQTGSVRGEDRRRRDLLRLQAHGSRTLLRRRAQQSIRRLFRGRSGKSGEPRDRSCPAW